MAYRFAGLRTERQTPGYDVTSPFMSGLKENLSNIVPLALNATALAMDEQKSNALLGLRKEELARQIQAEQNKNKLSVLQKQVENVYKTGDVDSAQKVHGDLMSLIGISPFTTDSTGRVILPDPDLLNPPKTPEEAMTREIIRLHKGKKQAPGAAEAAPAVPSAPDITSPGNIRMIDQELPIPDVQKLMPEQSSEDALRGVAGYTETSPFLAALSKVKGMAGGEKNQTKEQLTARALDGDKKALAILDEMQRRDLQVAKEKGAINVSVAQAGTEQFKTWDPATKEAWYQQTFVNKERPQFGFRDNASRSQYNKGYAEWLTKNGLSGGDVAEVRGSAKAIQSSLQTQEKNRGAMGSFVQNINGQVDKVEQLMQDVIKRVGVRALDMPYRELATRFQGSGHENVLKAYMKEISAEIDKLSQGSTASIAQLPVESRKDWERVHDVNLSLKELGIVLKGTREMANIRLKSVDDELGRTRSKLKLVGSRLEAEGGGATAETSIEPRKQGESIADYLKRTKK